MPYAGQFGARVVITGTSLLGGGAITSVTLADEAVDSIVSQTDSEVVVVVAASSTAKTGDVVLSIDNGASITRLDGWTYAAPANVTVLTPSVGQLGTEVVISGTSLLGGGSSVTSVTAD